jgi:ferredoxin
MTKLCVKIDLDLCQGHGVCQSEAPEVFSVEDTGEAYPQAVVLLDNPGPEYRDQVLQAEKFCPNSAIRVSEA